MNLWGLGIGCMNVVFVGLIRFGVKFRVVLV